MTENDKTFEKLRAKAEQLLRTEGAPPSPHLQQLEPEFETLIHELQTYDAEIQIQNEELRSTQSTLQNTLNRFESLFQSLPLAAVVIDSLGVIQQSNTLAASLFEFRNQNVIKNHSLLRLIQESDRPTLFESMGNQEVGKTIQIGPIKLERKEGVVVDFYLTLLPQSYHLDKHVLITFIDRSQFYRDQQSMSLMGALIDNTDSRVFAFDRSNRCLFANSKELDMIGLTHEEVIGKRRDLWMPIERAITLEHQDESIFVTQKSNINEEKIYDKNDMETYYVTHKFPLFDENKEVFGVGSISTEITEDRQQKQQLNLAMKAYHIGQEAVLISDKDNNIISVNSAFEKITGYKEEDIVGKNPRLLSSGSQDDYFYKTMWETLHTDGHWEGEIWNRRKSGDKYPEWLNISRIADANGDTVNFIAVFSDITSRKIAEEEIEQLAFFDTLTGLPNRYLLSDRVSQSIAEAIRNQHGFALIFFDLDRFKQINDVHGHDVGDQVLVEVAQRVNHLIREKDTLSRIGGDEFVLLMKDIKPDRIRNKLTMILSAIKEPYLYRQYSLKLSASFGIAIYPDDGNDYNTLMKNADTAMYAAKENGRMTFEFFNRSMAIKARNQLELETALSLAVENHELSLVYQPQLSVADKKVIGLEVLLRWDSEKLGEVDPSVFIPVAEQTGLILELGRWVIEQAISAFIELKQSHKDLTISINISARQLEDEHFIDHLVKTIKQASLEEPSIKAEDIELEITETLIMQKPKWSMQILKELKDLGLKLSLDDFGTGYSSLAYLHWMPIDILKVDKSFVSNIATDKNDEIICQTIIGLAKNLGLQTIAEGVETESSLKFLEENKCDNVQGHLFSLPLPKQQIIKWLQNH